MSDPALPAARGGPAEVAPSVTPHAAPFHCPYCGEEDLLPEEDEGTWRCASCARTFALRLLGVDRDRAARGER